MFGLVAKSIESQKPSPLNALSRGFLKGTVEPADIKHGYVEKGESAKEVAYSFINALSSENVDLDIALQYMHSAGRSKKRNFYDTLYHEARVIYERNYEVISESMLRLNVLLMRSKDITEKRPDRGNQTAIENTISMLLDKKFKSDNLFLVADNLLEVFNAAEKAFGGYLSEDLRQKLSKEYDKRKEILFNRVKRDAAALGEDIVNQRVSSMKEKLKDGRPNICSVSKKRIFD